MPSEDDPVARLAPLLEARRQTLLRFLAQEAAGLRRFESAEDLAQLVFLQALQGAAHFDDRGEAALDGWLRALARQVIARRHEHWRALKRDAGRVLRFSSPTSSVDGDGGTAGEPFDPATGPATFADRRDQMRLATRALASLLPRDQEVLRSWRSGEDTGTLAERLGISAGAAERARQRALERFWKAFAALGAAGR